MCAKSSSHGKAQPHEADLRLKLYEQAVRNSPDMVAIVDRDYVYRAVNPTYPRRYGRTEEEILGRSARDILDESIFEQTVRPHFDLCLTGERVNYQAWFAYPDIGSRYMDVSYHPIPAADGSIDNAVVILRDITDWKRTEEAFKGSLSLLTATVEAAADGLLVVDTRGNIRGFNQKLLDMWHIRGEALTAKDIFHVTEGLSDLCEHPDQERSDVLELEDGRVFERRSRPQQSEGNTVGIVLSFRDITEHKNAEDALRKSKERYRSMFWEAPDIFYVLDLETWFITDANKYAFEALEYGPEDLGKVSIVEIIHPEDFERATGRLRDMVVNKDRMPNFPLRVLTRTGKVLHIEQNGVIIWDEDGNAKSFLGLAHDVTYREEQEEMIRKRNKRLAALYDVVQTTTKSLNLETVIRDVLDLVPNITDSDAVGILSYDEASESLSLMDYQGFSESFVREADKIRVGEGTHGHVARTRKPLLIPTMSEHPLPDGRHPTPGSELDSVIVVPLMIRGKLLGTMTVARKAGNPYDSEDLELMVGLANQISIAIENAGLYSEIAQRETRLRSILETSRDGITVTTEHHRLAYHNQALSLLFGYGDHDDLTGMDTTTLFAPESHPALRKIQERLKDEEQIDEPVELIGRKIDGTLFDVEIRNGFFVENGKRFDVGIIRDVTERKRMQFQLLQSRKLAAIGELAAGISHEINNPIASVEVQTGLMRDILADEIEKLDKGFASRLTEYLSIVEEQIQRCLNVTGSLLSFSRSPEVETEKFDINELVKKAVTFVTSLTEKRPTVKMVLETGLPPFKGSPHRLEQVFVNLLNNAVKAAGADGTLTIVTRRTDRGKIEISFKDTGPGIPASIQPRIFDPFFTTRTEGEGTGLGLSISHYFIKEMHGQIDVNSIPGKGATFTIVLPMSGAREEGGDDAKRGDTTIDRR